jgi:hypothetical protein
MGWTRNHRTTNVVFLGRRAADLVRLNMRASGGRRHLRVY